MRRTLLPLLLAAAGCAPASAPPSPPQPVPVGTSAVGTLEAVVDSVIGQPPLHRTHWGIEITDLAGRVRLERNAERLFSAASNVKLATMAAALELLGPAFRWTTTIEARGVTDGVARAVVVAGSGDPTFSVHFHDAPLAPLDSMADSLMAAGVRRIAGPLVVSQALFDSLLVHPAWETYDLDWYYAAPVAPFAVMEGAYPVVITPRAVGAEATVELPVPLARADARVLTIEGDRGWNDDLRRIAGTDSVVLRGVIGAGAGPDTSWLAQDAPGRFAGRALVAALERRGIAVEGPVVVTRHPAQLALPGEPGARVIWRSAPLGDVAPIVLEQSDNWIAEQILKTLGAEHGEGGSWSAGTAVIETFLAERVGVDPGAVYLRDGSGLTGQTLLTPRALTATLRYAADRPWGALFRDALPSPGEAEGTLEDRLEGRGDRIAAKTGTIRHVNSLSGYAVARDGEVLVFSILTHASGRPASEVRRAMDRIVEAILDNGS